jgi:hypothetical protein
MAPTNLGSIIRVEYTGDDKVASGNMKLFSVRERMTADSA